MRRTVQMDDGDLGMVSDHFCPLEDREHSKKTGKSHRLGPKAGSAGLLSQWQCRTLGAESEER